MIIRTTLLRKDFTVWSKGGRFRHEWRVVSADGVDLAVPKGELLDYIGPNGAGKSTTLKMLTGVLTPSGGGLSVCGLTPAPRRTRLAARIGVVRTALPAVVGPAAGGVVLLVAPRVSRATHRPRDLVAPAVVDLDVAWPEGLELPGASVERVEADGLRVTLSLEGATAGEVVARLAGAVPLRDLSLREPEIEDVVARLYAAPRPERGPSQ